MLICRKQPWDALACPMRCIHWQLSAVWQPPAVRRAGRLCPATHCPVCLPWPGSLLLHFAIVVSLRTCVHDGPCSTCAEHWQASRASSRELYALSASTGWQAAVAHCGSMLWGLLQAGRQLLHTVAKSTALSKGHRAHHAEELLLSTALDLQPYIHQLLVFS